MGIRVITGLVAHLLVVLYWIWILACTAPELRRGRRDRRLRLRVLSVKTAAVLLTALLVGVIHYWATDWWQIVVAVPLATGGGVLLHRAHRRLVTTPRHRRPLAQRRPFRVRRTADGPAAHRRSAVVTATDRP